jgi:hypothetical protein
MTVKGDSAYFDGETGGNRRKETKLEWFVS